MFTRKHLQHQTKLQPVASLTKLISVEGLLNESKYQPLLSRITSLMALNKADFNSLCFDLMRNMLAYCEALPESSGRYYAERGGVFEYALQRTEAALSLFTSYTMVDEGKGLSEEQRCWQYALFSASMLYGIGKLYLDYCVTLYSAKGVYLKEWNPFHGDLISGAQYYQCKVVHEPQVEFRSRLNLLLAKIMMPKEGFEWLTSNRTVFEAWLALLQEDLHGARVLGAVLSNAEAIALQRAIDKMLLKQEGAFKARSFRTFEQPEKESTKDIAEQIGLEFVEWLKEQIEKGEMTFNQAPLLVVPAGLVMGDELFKWFVREHAEYKNWQAVRQGFLSLGLHDMTISAREQIIFARFGVALPSKVQFFNANTGKTSWVSATDLLYFVKGGARLAAGESTEKAMALPHLNHQGVWQAAAPDSFLSPGMSSRRG